jgi:hypothetical protein
MARLSIWLLAMAVLTGGLFVGTRSALAAECAGADAFGLAVSGADQDFIPGDSSVQPPAGRNWILVTASLQNLGGPAVVVEPGTLTLVDDAGQRYTPAPPSERIQPSVVGATLTPGEWILGMALFEVPEGTRGEWVEWCPGTTEGCAAPLRSPIPLTPSGR